jgi:DNA replication protein DnaC
MSDLSPGLAHVVSTLPDDRGLYLYGAPGRGKTHACVAAMKRLWFRGADVVWANWDQLLLRVRSTYKPTGPSEMDVLKPLFDADAVVLDDVGVTVSRDRQESDFALRVLLLVLDERLNQCRATYITSNKNPAEIGKSFDARTQSRIEGGCTVVRLEGPDRRAARHQTPNPAQEPGRSAGCE